MIEKIFVETGPRQTPPPPHDQGTRKGDSLIFYRFIWGGGGGEAPLIIRFSNAWLWLLLWLWL